MRLRLNAKGDSVSTVVLWVGSLIAALVCIAWLSKNLYPEQVTVQAVDNELTVLQRDLNTACRMDQFWKVYYPKIRTGTLFINRMQVCMDSSDCKAAYYSTNGTEEETDDGNIMLNNSFTCQNIERCSVLYYDSPNYAFQGPDYLFASNATSCRNKHQPVMRCRTLTCDLNHTLTVYLRGITGVNMTKDENGTFAAIPY
jgi:hypothetical protein